MCPADFTRHRPEAKRPFAGLALDGGATLARVSARTSRPVTPRDELHEEGATLTWLLLLLLLLLLRTTRACVSVAR